MRGMRPLGILLALALWTAAPTGSTSATGTADLQTPASTAKSRAAAAAARRPPMLRRQERGRRIPGASTTEVITPTVFEEQADRRQGEGPRHVPREERLQRAGSFDGDLRSLRDNAPVKKRERPEREGPQPTPVQLTTPSEPIPSGIDVPQALNAPAPGPSASFEGLDFATWGAGHPPDTNGDVGPTHYIQSVNTALGIYDKASGARIAAFTFDTFMSQGNFGNLCDTENFGDPVVVYDSFEDRWVISDFAFMLDGSNNVVNPPGAFQCFAVSKTSDPVSGGWNFYSINTTGGLGDYPKLGIWPDGIYMSVNMFDYAATGKFQNVRLYALNKTQMYAGSPSVQVVSFDVPATEFSLLPANARLQTGTPPAGSPNYFASVWNYLNVVGVWKFRVDWNSISLSTLTGPFNSQTSTSWSQLTSNTVPSPGNRLDTLYPRLIMQNQYTNTAGIESLWDSHTVGASGTTSAQAAVRYYEVRVTGGTVAANATQAFTYSPNTTNRFMPSVALDRTGNMAIGYSATSTTLNPAIRYAGRLAGDAANTITQTEATLIAGGGTQSGNCGGSSCVRWGDYSAMSLDPNGCTFWYTSEYYQVTGLNNRTRVGAFAFPSCTPVTPGSLQGTVKTSSAAPIAGATVMLGSRTAVTDASGNYSFSDIPAGTYPNATAAFAGYTSFTFTSIVIAGGATTTRDFVLGQSAQSGCVTETTQADFQSGVAANCDVTGTLGSVTLLDPQLINQQNLSVTSSGFGFTATDWAGQTFTPTVTGKLTKVDLDLFCSGCTGTTPNITVSIRATTGSPLVPTGVDLATATIAGFSSGAGGFFSAQFGTPVTLTAGTRYAIVFRPIANPSAGLYAYVCSCTGQQNQSGTNPYVTGQFVTFASSSGTWTADTTSGGRDLGFVTYMQSGFAASGTFVSSTKDANPTPAKSAAWGALSWTASVPAGTSVQFQAAASDSASGPFTFVGPDGTASTFFSNGGSLEQFNGRRYLKYRVVMTTSNSSVTPSIQDVTVCFNNGPSASTVTQTLVSGGTRLQQLQNADGGWFFRATDTSCTAVPGASCPNTIGTTGLGLLSDYDRAHDPSVLSDAIAAAQLMQALHNAAPSLPPFSQDLEFLTALSATSGDPQYAALSVSWFTTISTTYPNPITRADLQFDRRNASLIRTLAVWDLSSMIRAAKAAGNVAYASGLANRVIAREVDWKDLNPAHRWDQCADPGGCGPVGNKRAFDYTLLGMGSMLWAIHDLPGFDTKITEYRSFLLSQQDATGTWDAGDLEITSYAALGLGAVGGAGTIAANQSAVAFYIANQLPNGGWPFSITTAGSSPEYASVDSEVIRAIGTLYGTPPGQRVQVAPSQLATVTFDHVSVAGSTTVVAQAAPAPAPFGYAIVAGLTYEVTTTATTDGPSTVCFDKSLTPGLADARILHLENGKFVDRTGTAHCAETTGLNTFAIARIDPNAIDRDPPMLTASLSPALIARADNKFVTVTATIDVADNADASPAITLVSISIAGEDHGKKEDIEDAAIGTDDRSFRLRAEAGKSGRVYTVVYRATDRSGNSTEISSTVVVR